MLSLVAGALLGAVIGLLVGLLGGVVGLILGPLDFSSLAGVLGLL